MRGLAAALALTLAACGRDGGRGSYVARVNTAVLTESDIAHQRDSLGETGAGSREYINDWVVNELLYQEAERRGLTDEAAFREQLDEMRKRLAVAALLQEAVYARVDSSALTEDSLAALFARSGQTYLLREDITLASYALFRDRDAANTFRAAVLRGASWETTLADLQSKDPHNNSPSCDQSTVSSSPVRRSTLKHSGTWRVLLRAKTCPSPFARTRDILFFVRTRITVRGNCRLWSMPGPKCASAS